MYATKNNCENENDASQITIHNHDRNSHKESQIDQDPYLQPPITTTLTTLQTKIQQVSRAP